MDNLALKMRRKRLYDVIKDLQIALEDAEWSCLAGDSAAITPEHIASAIRALVYEIATDGALEEKVRPNIMGIPLPQD